MVALIDIWKTQRDFIEDKSVEQVLSMAGDGVLRDNSETSNQFRELLANMPRKCIERYTNECLSRSFKDSGMVLQDLITETGSRLGFAVEHGFYRGGVSRIGCDGIWRTKDGYSFVIEVKTTDAYQLNLDVQAGYRERLIKEGSIDEKKSSILVVIGRKDTGGLEAQTRGSRHAWDVRLVSVDALLKLMTLKENMSDDATIAQFQEILKPHEYTRIDRLIDIIFTTSEDLQGADAEPVLTTDEQTEDKDKSIPAKYHDDCVERISSHMGVPLIKQGRCTYTSADKSVRVVCLVSRDYSGTDSIGHWFCYHPSQLHFLDEAEKSFVALGCGSADNIILIPSREFHPYLAKMNKTENEVKSYWHVRVFRKNELILLNKRTEEGINITRYKI